MKQNRQKREKRKGKLTDCLLNRKRKKTREDEDVNREDTKRESEKTRKNIKIRQSINKLLKVREKEKRRE